MESLQIKARILPREVVDALVTGVICLSQRLVLFVRRLRIRPPSGSTLEIRGFLGPLLGVGSLYGPPPTM
jgi:hypothetical protein